MQLVAMLACGAVDIKYKKMAPFSDMRMLTMVG